MIRGGQDLPATKREGFTIVETLLVLAVSATLAITALLFVAGRQNKTEFMTGINGAQQLMQQIINETASGYFPDGQNFQCQAVAGNSLNITAGSRAQGQNVGCVFLGKILQFGVANDSTYPHPTASQYNLYSIAANQYGYTLDGVNGAFPTAVKYITTGAELPYGLTPSYLKYVDASGTHVTAAVGFLATDSSRNIATTGANGLNSGAQNSSLYAVGAQPIGQLSRYDMDTKPGSVLASSLNYVNASAALLCLNGATTSQSGLITIGNPTAGSHSLAVSLQIFPNQDCT